MAAGEERGNYRARGIVRGSPKLELAAGHRSPFDSTLTQDAGRLHLRKQPQSNEALRLTLTDRYGVSLKTTP